MWVVSIVVQYGGPLLGCVLLACYHVTVHDIMPVASGKDLKEAESGRPEAMKVDKLILNPPQQDAAQNVSQEPKPSTVYTAPASYLRWFVKVGKHLHAHDGKQVTHILCTHAHTKA